MAQEPLKTSLFLSELESASRDLPQTGSVDIILLSIYLFCFTQITSKPDLLSGTQKMYECVKKMKMCLGMFFFFSYLTFIDFCPY